MTARMSVIAAVARNAVIGRDHELPWRLPADLRHFKQITMGKPLLMGRRTWVSIGRPLPGRTMIVLTSDVDYRAPGCLIVHTLDEGLALAGAAEEIMVIGGAAVYAQALPLADQLYLTQIAADIAGDTWFPAWDRTAWHLQEEIAHSADADHAWPYCFQHWVRDTTILDPPS